MNKLTRIFMLSLLTLTIFATVNQFAAAADNISYEHYLIRSLNDENIGRRASAARLLGEQKTVQAIEPLLKLLKKETDFRVRIVAVVSLSKVADSTIVPNLKTIHKYEKNNTVRHVLAGVITELKNRNNIVTMQ